MYPFSRKQIVIGILVMVIILLFALFMTRKEPTSEPQVEEYAPLHTVIGTSVEGRALDAYTYESQAGGSGSKVDDARASTHLVFVGGVHGGYEWNSVVLAYQLMDYLKENPESIPLNLSVTVIPSANPDGVFKVIGKSERFAASDVLVSAEETIPGRFNARGVDLNRNFDCKWQSEGQWRGNSVGTGSNAFSEPETRALRDFALRETPTAVIFFHSQANTVYASECEEGILPETLTIMDVYAEAAEYQAVPAFDAYPVNGDAEGWLASIGVPAITVELETHETIEWQRNLAGIKALFEYYGEDTEIVR